MPAATAPTEPRRTAPAPSAARTPAPAPARSDAPARSATAAPTPAPRNAAPAPTTTRPAATTPASNTAAPTGTRTPASTPRAAAPSAAPTATRPAAPVASPAPRPTVPATAPTHRPAAAAPPPPRLPTPSAPQRTEPSAAVRAAASEPRPSRIVLDSPPPPPPPPRHVPGEAPYVAPLSGGVVRQASPLSDGIGDDSQAIPLRPLPPPAPKPTPPPIAKPAIQPAPLPIAKPAPQPVPPPVAKPVPTPIPVPAPIAAPPPPAPVVTPPPAPTPIALPPPAPVAIAPLAPSALPGEDAGGEEILLEAAAGPAPAPALVSVDVEAYADGLVPSALARGGLAGAVVVVVKDGQILLAKGYGYADRAKGRPMDAARTVIRPGSISKLFTWTAVMQLVEQGKLDLDADVNDYLDFRIRDYHGQGITLRQLMTHSAGFEESSKHLFAADASRLRPLRAYLETVQPQRIYPPGKVPAYSNYGVALAGYIVERVARQPFNDYIEQHVLMPLDMRRSTFRQPLPKGLAGDVALSYASAGAQPIGFELVNPAPAGALSTTGRDMAHFMIAQLDQGRYRGVEILKPYTAQAMQRAASTPVAGLDSMTLGFFRRDKHGLVAIGHGGATQAFQSNLALVPDKKLGVFVSVDGPGAAGRALHRDLIDGLLKRYYPERGTPPATRLTARLHGKQLVGRYENSRQSASNFLAIARFLGSSVVTLNDDDTVSVSSLRTRDGRIKRWREIEPYVWQELDGDSRLAAKREHGQIVAIASDDAPPAMWLQPVPAWRSAGWMLPLLYAAAAVHVLALALWPAAALVRRHTQRRLKLDGRERDLRLLTFFGLIANLALLALWLWILGRVDASATLLDGQLDPALRIAQLLGVLSIAVAVVALLNARAAWKPPMQRLRRVCAVAMAAACVAVVWFVLALHTLQWSLVY
ncbi:CubicO group peptidase, beta-lactamase class C family [Lysobacter enzymogenes]|nr:CubicO group peptidase, beta-lactamase class C family [Lysobacter enzymogenes]